MSSPRGVRPVGGVRVLLAAASVLAIGLAATGATAWQVHRTGQRAAVAAVNRHAELAATAVGAEMRRYQDTVEAAAAALSAQQDLRAADFATVTGPLRNARLAGASGVILVVPATDPEVAPAQRYWRGQGATGLVLAPSGTGVTHLFTIFSRSLDGQPSAVLGRDLSQSPPLTRVLAEAGRRNQTSVSDTYVLLKDARLPAQQQQLSFVLVAPVSNVEGTRLRGWVLLGLRGGDLLRTTLQQATQRKVNITLTASGQPQVVARLASGPAHDATLLVSVPVPVAQRQWLLTVQSTDATAAADGAGYRARTATLAAGGTATVLIVTILYLLMTSRGRALGAVEIATAELRTAEEGFRFAFDQAPVGMAMVSIAEHPAAPPGRLIRVNDALCAMLGRSRDELAAASLLELSHEDDREAWRLLLTPQAWSPDLDDAASTLTAEPRLLHADGRTVRVKIHSTVIRDREHAPSYAITQIEDVTQRRAESQRLHALALQDPLTGLSNRAHLNDRLQQAAAQCARSRRVLAVLFCDLNGFKPINDQHGHAAGDDVLRQVAARIQRVVRPTDTVARLGGDEFVVLCPDLEQPGDLHQVRARLRAAIEQPITIQQGTAGPVEVQIQVQVQVQVSIGTATATGEGIDVDTLLDEADRAMYAQKLLSHT